MNASLPKIETVSIPEAKEETSYLIQRVLSVATWKRPEQTKTREARLCEPHAQPLASLLERQELKKGVEIDEKSVLY